MGGEGREGKGREGKRGFVAWLPFFDLGFARLSTAMVFDECRSQIDFRVLGVESHGGGFEHVMSSN
jgi:hypothetical protein